MRLLPTRLSLIDEILNTGFNDSFFRKTSSNIMKTNISEKDGSYLLDIELPGYKKEEIKIDLEQGYLTITANKEESKEEKDNKGNIIHQERITGCNSRSYYIGDDYTEEDIAAKYDNGELQISIKAKDQKEIEEKKTIMIE